MEKFQHVHFSDGCIVTIVLDTYCARHRMMEMDTSERQRYIYGIPDNRVPKKLCASCFDRAAEVFT